MRLLMIALALPAIASAFPADKNDDVVDKPSDIRSRIITKHDFISRQRKSQHLPKLPKPFVVSTELNVRDKPDVDKSQRRGRTWLDPDGSTVVVEGIRVPDDESDRVTWRNGRVINNVFVPYVDADQARASRQQQQQQEQLARQPRQGFPGFQVPQEVVDLADQVAVETQRREDAFAEGREYTYHAGSTEAGRPVYYVVEDAVHNPAYATSTDESLHSDRSPYVYEPADSHTSLVNDYTQQGYAQHSQYRPQQQQQQQQGDFVIKEHTYSMCPGCPTFSIPVPVPKATDPGQQQQQYQDPVALPYSGLQEQQQQPIKYQHARNMTFLEKVGNSVIATMQGFQDKVLDVLKAGQKVRNRFLNPFGGGDGEEEDDSGLSTNQLSEKSDPGHVDRHGDASSGQIVTKKQGGGGTSPMALAGYAVAGVGAVVLLNSAMTLARVNAKNQVVDSGGKNFASDGGSHPLAFLSSLTDDGGANGPWHESLARYWQIGEDLGWDPQCIVGEICADLAPQQGQRVDGVVETLIHKACINRVNLPRCNELKNAFRRRKNHKPE